VTSINISINKVLFPAFAELQDNSSKLKKYMQRAIKTDMLIMIPLLLGFSASANSIVEIVLTDKWLPCVPFIQIFCIYYIFVPIHTINIQVFKAVGRTDINMKLAIVDKIYGILILLVSIMFFNTVEAIAIGLIIQAFIACILYGYPNKKICDYGTIEQIKDIIPTIIVGLVMYVLVSLVRIFELNNFIILIIQISIGIISYTTMLSIFKFESYLYIKSYIIDRIGKKRHR
jgi:O-antigen/teichoic acid export membrane protein